MELKNFQKRAVAELTAAMAIPSKRDIVLESPTGSGKTIVLTHFMREYMRDNPGTAFVWLTPGKGELEEQSREKMARYCPNASTKSLADVMMGGFAAGDAVFVNWEKLTKTGSNALKESERTNFAEWTEKAIAEGVAFKVVVDESHQNFTEKADAIVELFKTDKIIRASATPLADKNAHWIRVPEEDVIAEGLIKKMIEINPDFPSKIEFKAGETEAAWLLGRGLAKRGEIAARFAADGVNVNPLVVVQLPNNEAALLKDVEAWFAAKGIDCASGTLAVWLAGRHDNLDGIEKNGAKSVAVIIKQAVATGWDCPRAHVLVKLRENMDERFEIQTIGRIRRMPEAKHYGGDLLDHCYLYTLDAKFTEGMKKSLGSRALEAKKLFVAAERKTFSLVKEQRTMVSETRDPAAALAAIGGHLAKKYKLEAKAEAFEANMTRLEAAGWSFRDDIWKHTQTGEAAVLAEMKKNDFNEVDVSTAISTHLHGRDFHHDVGEIGAACPLPYEDTRAILFVLFGTDPADGKKLLALDPKRLYAFVINNAERLKGDFREALAAELPLTTSKEKVVEKEFRIPGEWVCTFDATLKGQTAAKKNVYKGYPMSARPRSDGEMKLEKWCEAGGGVDWWYRNGDKGDEYFSIVYEDNAKRQRLFYPDYILSVRGETWIVEVKGGFDPSSKSRNIDIYAPKKAAALKGYCAKHGVRGGFVCNSASENELLFFENGFSEDESNPGWKLIGETEIA